MTNCLATTSKHATNLRVLQRLLPEQSLIFSLTESGNQAEKLSSLSKKFHEVFLACRQLIDAKPMQFGRTARSLRGLWADDATHSGRLYSLKRAAECVSSRLRKLEKCVGSEAWI
jgi:hypothetical protein